jgi:hypothetical protein
MENLDLNEMQFIENIFEIAYKFYLVYIYLVQKYSTLYLTHSLLNKYYLSTFIFKFLKK